MLHMWTAFIWPRAHVVLQINLVYHTTHTPSLKNKASDVYASFKVSVFSVLNVYIVVLKWVSLILKMQMDCWILMSCLLCHVFVELFSFSDVKVCALIAALDCTYGGTQFLFGCLVLKPEVHRARTALWSSFKVALAWRQVPQTVAWTSVPLSTVCSAGLERVYKWIWKFWDQWC